MGAAPSWASRTESSTPPPKAPSEPEWADMKKSADALRGRRASFGEDAALFGAAAEEVSTSFGSLGLGGSGEGTDEETILPENIASFLKITEDSSRQAATNYVVQFVRKKIEEGDEEFCSRCVLTVARLALESSFASVRTSFAELLELMQKAKFRFEIPSLLDRAVVTKWVSPEQLPSVQRNNLDSLTSRLLRSIEVLEGRVPHIIVVLAWHPTFLEKWYRTMMHLMRGNGPLPFTWRVRKRRRGKRSFVGARLFFDSFFFFFLSFFF